MPDPSPSTAWTRSRTAPPSTRPSASSCRPARCPAACGWARSSTSTTPSTRRPKTSPTWSTRSGWSEKLRDFYKDLSGGQKQRLSVALALIGRPRVAVLDEMTTGLDPQARRDTWDLVEGVRRRGVTVVLVTHYMDEAERLCDRLAVIDHGRVVATGTPAALAADAGGAKVVRFAPSGPIGDHVLTDLPEVETVKADNGEVVVTGRGELVNAVILTLAAHDVTARDVRLTTPTLEDAFVRLTGPR